MTDDKQAEALAKERADKAPLTGVLSTHDVLRHLLTHGPARSDAERAELLAPVNADDPDYTEPEAQMTPEQKAAEYDRLKAQAETPAAPDLTVSERDELARLRRDQETRDRDRPVDPATGYQAAPADPPLPGQSVPPAQAPVSPFGGNQA
jgi:hypothetical protein